MTETVALLGASGFLGSTVLEHLETRSSYTITPFAGSTGGATALAHAGRTFNRVDMLDRHALEAALSGFDYVINCARGDSAVLQDGFDNLLAAARAGGIRKLVHISSVAIYGDPPHPASVTEEAPVTTAEHGYAAVKRDQDTKLQQAAQAGLGAVILCPPNIIGPYSDYLLDIIESIERGRFRLVESGATEVNVIDVHALAATVGQALASDVNDGRRLFVTHPETITWRDLCDALQPVLRTHAAIPGIDAEAVRGIGGGTRPAPGGARGSALKHLISEDVREALKSHPTWAAIESTGKRLVRAFGDRAEGYMRHVANGPIRVPQQRLPDAFDRALVSQQLRRIKHQPDRCLADLAMQFPVDFAESMARFNAWYSRYFDAESRAWQLLAHRVD